MTEVRKQAQRDAPKLEGDALRSWLAGVTSPKPCTCGDCYADNISSSRYCTTCDANLHPIDWSLEP